MKTVNCPEVCSNVTSRTRTIRLLRAMVAKLASDSGLPCRPAGSASKQERGDNRSERRQRGEGETPAEMRGEHRHHRQAAGDRQRPAEEDEGDGARPLLPGTISATVAAACGV